MRSASLFLTLVLGLASLKAHAGQVTQVLADQVFILVAMDHEGELQVDDRVCFSRESTRVGCGLVVATTAKGAKVKIMEQSRTVKSGDSVHKVTDAEAPTPTTTSGIRPAPSSDADQADADVLLGIKQNFTSTNSFLHLQFATNNSVAFGLEVNLLKITLADVNHVSGTGGALTIDYYSRGNFEGLWLDMGTGFDSFPAASTGIGGTTYSPIIQGQIGWRAKWAMGLNIGIAASVQYYLLPFGVSAQYSFSAFQPFLSADIGLKF